MIPLLFLLAAFPPDTIVMEAESFEVEAHWTPGRTRESAAVGGLSGGAALNSNRVDALARARVQLPRGEWTVWARVFDWGGAPDHYDLDLSINGRSKGIGVTEPVFGAFVWERWGIVAGGSEARLELSNADPFNSVVDCIAFVRDPQASPSMGPELGVVDVVTYGDFDKGSAVVAVCVCAQDAIEPVANASAALVRRRRNDRIDIVWQEDLLLAQDPRAWASGTTIDLPEIRLPESTFLWPGEYAVVVSVPGTAWAAGHEVATVEKSRAAMPEPCRAAIQPYHGRPGVWVDGKPQFAFAFLMHTGDFDKEYRQMADIGVRFFTASAGIGATPDGFDPSDCDGPFLQILRHQPRALIFPRVGVTAPGWWLDEHPDDRVVFDDGSLGPQSMFSEAWRADACRWIEDYSRHIRNSPYADHVVGIHICSGVSAEWQSWGLWEDRRGDFSPVARRAWREYLRAKYGSDAALANAWGRPVSIDAVEAPTRARRESEPGFLRMPGDHQDLIDFYDFYWRGTAKAIQALAAAAKRGGGRDWLVGFFYGYAIQYGGKMQESQHLGMREAMDCPDIDFFCSPAMYSNRHPGGTSTFMSFTESLRLRGKFWWNEADARTHLAVNNPVAPAADLFETLNVLEREFAHACSRGAGLWWFDMQGGWYDDPAILELFRQMRRFGEENTAAWRPKVETAVFIDDKSSYRLKPEEAFLHEAVTAFLARMPTLGAPYDTYLLSDVARAPEYKLYVFPLAFDLTDAERAAINALKRDGKTLLFAGPAGIGSYRDGRIEHDPALAEALIGLQPEGETWRKAGLGDWQVVWAPGPAIAVDDVRDVARAAGVHLYHEESDAFYAGNGLVALHAREDGGGPRTLRFPRPVEVRELFAATPLAATGAQVSFDLRAAETRCFAVAPVSGG